MDPIAGPMGVEGGQAPLPLPHFLGLWQLQIVYLYLGSAWNFASDLHCGFWTPLGDCGAPMPTLSPNPGYAPVLR